MAVLTMSRRGTAMVSAGTLSALALAGCAGIGGDSRTAAEKVAEECATEGVEFVADGEVLTVRVAMGTIDNDEAFSLDANSEISACIEEQGLLDSDLEGAFEDVGADDATGFAMFSEDGMVLISDGMFMRATVWDGDEQMTDIGVLLAEAFSQIASDEFVAPDDWALQFEIGPDDGRYEATDLTALADGWGDFGDGDSGDGAVTAPPIAFGETFAYDDGLEVTVGELGAFEPSEWAWGEGEEYVVVTVTITNGTGEVFDPSGFSTTASSAGREAEEVWDTDSGIEGAPQTSLQPGKSVSFEVAYGVDDAADVTLDVSPDWFEHDTFTATTG